MEVMSCGNINQKATYEPLLLAGLKRIDCMPQEALIKPGDLKFLGHDLNKPTCIVKGRHPMLYCTDTEHGIVAINIDTGIQTPYLSPDQHISGEQVNAFTWYNEQSFIAANMSAGQIELITPQINKEILFDSIAQQPLGKVNFICPGPGGGFWATICTRKTEHFSAFSPDVNDGYIAWIKGNKIKIVADQLYFPNEAKMDAKGHYLYVAETSRQAISRFRIKRDGNLGPREHFGPKNFGPGGYPDGIAFDAVGNLWCTLVFGEKIVVISPSGKTRLIFDDGHPQAIAAVDAAFKSSYIDRETAAQAASKNIPFVISLTFAGNNNDTVFIGSFGNSIACFKAPQTDLF